MVESERVYPLRLWFMRNWGKMPVIIPLTVLFASRSKIVISSVSPVIFQPDMLTPALVGGQVAPSGRLIFVSGAV